MVTTSTPNRADDDDIHDEPIPAMQQLLVLLLFSASRCPLCSISSGA